MIKTRIDPADLERIHLRGIFAGVLVCLSVMTLLLSTVRPIIAPDPTSIMGEVIYWLASSMAWVISVFVGAAVGALASRARAATTGAIEGLVVWAAGYMIFTFVFVLRAPELSLLNPDNLPRSVALRDLLVEALAIFAAISGGRIGAGWKSNPPLLREAEGPA